MPESNLYLGIIIRSQNTDYPLKYVPVFAYEERHFSSALSCWTQDGRFNVFCGYHISVHDEERARVLFNNINRIINDANENGVLDKNSLDDLFIQPSSAIIVNISE